MIRIDAVWLALGASDLRGGIDTLAGPGGARLRAGRPGPSRLRIRQPPCRPSSLCCTTSVANTPVRAARAFKPRRCTHRSSTRVSRLRACSRKPLQDVRTSIRIGRPLTECGLALQASAERHLRSLVRLGQLYPSELLEQTVVIASRCLFSLDELRYEYPTEVVPEGESPSS